MKNEQKLIQDKIDSHSRISFIDTKKISGEKEVKNHCQNATNKEKLSTPKKYKKYFKDTKQTPRTTKYPRWRK